MISQIFESNEDEATAVIQRINGEGSLHKSTGDVNPNSYVVRLRVHNLGKMSIYKNYSFSSVCSQGLPFSADIRDIEEWLERAHPGISLRSTVMLIS